MEISNLKNFVGEKEKILANECIESVLYVCSANLDIMLESKKLGIVVPEIKSVNLSSKDITNLKKYFEDVENIKLSDYDKKGLIFGQETIKLLDYIKALSALNQASEKIVKASNKKGAPAEKFFEGINLANSETLNAITNVLNQTEKLKNNPDLYLNQDFDTRNQSYTNITIYLSELKKRAGELQEASLRLGDLVIKSLIELSEKVPTVQNKSEEEMKIIYEAQNRAEAEKEKKLKIAKKIEIVNSKFSELLKIENVLSASKSKDIVSFSKLLSDMIEELKKSYSLPLKEEAFIEDVINAGMDLYNVYKYLLEGMDDFASNIEKSYYYISDIVKEKPAFLAREMSSELMAQIAEFDSLTSHGLKMVKATADEAKTISKAYSMIESMAKQAELVAHNSYNPELDRFSK